MKASRAKPLLAPRALAIAAAAVVVAGLTVSLGLSTAAPTPTDGTPAATPPAVSDPGVTAADAAAPRGGLAPRIDVRPFSPSASDLSSDASLETSTLPGPWILRGVVTSEAGAPVAGARVFVADPSVFVAFSDPHLLARGWFRDDPFAREATAGAPPSRDDSRGGAIRSTTTNGAGRFEVELTSCRGVASAFVSHDEFGDAAVSNVVLGTDAPTEVALRMHAIVSLYGSVTDSVTGKPVDMATIEVDGGIVQAQLEVSRHQNELVEVTDSDGHWWCFPRRCAALTVTAHPRGYFPATARVSTAASTTAYRVDLVVDPKPELAGRIVDAAGAPAHLAQALADPQLDASCELGLWLSDEDPLLVPDFNAAKHDDAALWVAEDTYVGDVSSRTSCWVSLWYGRDTLLGRAPFDRAHPSPDIVVDTSRITPAASADAVLDVSAADSLTSLPIDRFEVHVTRMSRDGLTETELGRVPVPCGSANDRHLCVTGLGAGTYRVRVTAEGYAPADVRATVAAHDTQLCVVQLKPLTASLAGVVRDSGGAPVADVVIEAHGVPYGGAHDVRGTAFTAVDGSFLFGELPAGDYVLFAFARAGGRAAKLRAQVRVPGSAVTVTLGAGARVDFEPPADAGLCWYTVVAASEEFPITAWDGSGSGVGQRETVLLPPGDYVVSCDADGFEQGRVAFTAVGGATQRVPIPMVPVKK